MKRFLPLLFLAVIAFSCDVIVVEPAVDPRDKFVGHYELDEYSKTLDVYTLYHIDIVKAGHYGNTVYIKNFYGSGITVRGEVHGYKIDIPLQFHGYYEIEGVATWEGRDIHFSYTVYEESCCDVFTDYCTAVAY